MKSIDTKKQLLQNPFNLTAWKLHERRIAQLDARARNQQRARWIRENYDR
jgi:hypothetical protein